MENDKVFAATHCLIRKCSLRKVSPDYVSITVTDSTIPNITWSTCRSCTSPASARARKSTKQPTTAGIEVSVVDALKGYDWQKSKGPLYVVVRKNS